MNTYAYPTFDYHRPAELDGNVPHRAIAIVGGGVVGLTMALDLASRGVASVVFDDDNSVSYGSRAVCQAKRTLEIWDRLGLAAPMMEKGVTWNEGHVFCGEEKIYGFNLQDNPDAKFPAFINLQQYYCEEYLVRRITDEPLVDLRWCHKVTGITQEGDSATLTVETPDGTFDQTCDWVIAADGVRSAIRRALDIPFTGQVFEDHFLIADIVMESDWPAIRRFYFDPPWGPEASALMHKQADKVWRLDFQLGWDIDKEEELKPENVIPRVKRMIGEDTPFEMEWTSIYTFQCRSIEKYRHGNVLFIGDAAHQVSPFGARGGNGGIQDADNLAWKLALVVQGDADEALLDTYHEERHAAAEENILNSTRATDFITPKTPVSEVYRNAVLDLAALYPFGRALVNSGRLSVPKRLHQSSLNGPSELEGDIRPGDPVPALPVEIDGATHLIDLLGDEFVALVFGDEAGSQSLSVLGLVPRTSADVTSSETLGTSPRDEAWIKSIASAFGAEAGGCVLVRPDQHVLATFRHYDPAVVEAEVDRVLRGRRKTV